MQRWLPPDSAHFDGTITLERSNDRFGPLYIVVVDHAGLVTLKNNARNGAYFGHRTTAKPGEIKTETIDSLAVQQLLRVMKHENFFRLSDSIVRGSRGCPYPQGELDEEVVTVTEGSQIRRLLNYEGCSNDPEVQTLTLVGRQIDSVAGVERWSLAR